MLVSAGPALVRDNGTEKQQSEYEQMLWKMQYDAGWLKEVSLGKRVGLYRFSETIGSGNFSQVKLATHMLTRDKVAVKIIDKTKLDVKTRKMINQEIKSMEAVHHPNIIRLLEVMDTYQKMYLVLEYAGGGQLYGLVSAGGALSDDRARTYFLQVAQAVQHMHCLGFVHRDIKAENVFLAHNDVVKLGDFGFSAHLQQDPHQKLNTFCGSPPYAAPELYCDDRYSGQPVDVWALGVLLYFLLTAAVPFHGATVGQLKANILRGEYEVPITLPQPCRYIIENTLVQNPAERLTLTDILANEWFNKPKANPTTGVRKNSLMFLTKKLRRQPPSTERRRKSILRDLELKRIPEIIRSNKTSDISAIPNKSKTDETDSCGVKNKVHIQRNTYAKGKSFDTASLPSTRPDQMLLTRDGEATELGRFVMFPTAVTELDSVCLLERMARERLARFGITSQLLLEHLSHGSNSPVIGAYRCIVNRIIEEQYVWDSLSDPDLLMKVNRVENAKSDGRKSRSRYILARVCSIL